MEKVWELYKSINVETLRDKSRAARAACFIGLIGFFMGRVALFGFMNPFLIAFSSNFIGRERKIYMLAIPMAVGVITRFEGLLLLKNLSALLLIILGHMLLSLAQIRPKNMTIRVIAGFAAAFSGVLFALLLGGEPYLMFMAIGGAIFAVTLTVLMKESTALLSGKHKQNVIDNEGAISLMIVLGASVAGAADIYIGNFALKYIICALIILLGSKRGGAPIGAVCGVSLGVILTLTGAVDPVIIGVMSVGGITAGFARAGGKKAVIAGFLAGAILSALYFDMRLIDTYLLFSFGGAIALFIIIPDNFSMKIGQVTVDAALEEANQAKALVEQRLSDMATSFKNMGRTLEGKAERRQDLSQSELSRIVDDTLARACSECPHKGDCWGENFYQTYQMSLRVLEDCEAGREHDLTAYNGLCEHIGYFSGWLSRQYDIYKLNLNWQNQMAESRRLISQQLWGVSEVIDELLLEIRQKETIKNEFSLKITTAFAKKNIEVSNVIILENAHGKFGVSLERKSCLSDLRCFREAASIISSCLGRRMTVSKKHCSEGVSARQECRLSFIEEPRFRVHSGAAYAKKDGSAYSGDCHSVMEIRGSQIILALSDGMGSGKKARAESEAAMGLLEDFLEAGFSRELALRLINSVLVLKDGSEHSSTMDICSIDLHTGAAQFVKVGAAATFIKRGSSVAQITSESLPMGILTEIDVEVCNKDIRGGDIIVMVTDGVCDSGSEESVNGLERNWITRALSEIDSKNPQDIADYLVGVALKRSDDVIKDDMTVLCARVREKIR